MRWRSLLVGIGMMFTGANFAQAADARITERVELLAGPAADFPRVRTLPPGTAVTVHGCTRGYRWCDVTWRGKRGWVDSAYMVYGNEQTALVSMSGAGAGLPQVEFDCAAYWDKHYKSQIFYDDRSQWLRHSQARNLAEITPVALVH